MAPSVPMSSVVSESQSGSGTFSRFSVTDVTSVPPDKSPLEASKKMEVTGDTSVWRILLLLLQRKTSSSLFSRVFFRWTPATMGANSIKIMGPNDNFIHWFLTIYSFISSDNDWIFWNPYEWIIHKLMNICRKLYTVEVPPYDSPPCLLPSYVLLSISITYLLPIIS